MNERLIVFPVWTVGLFDPQCRSVAKMGHPDGDIAVVLFTDDDAARHYFRASAAPEGYTLKSFAAAESLASFLEELESRGETHAIVDPSVTRIAAAIPLGFLIARLRQSL